MKLSRSLLVLALFLSWELVAHAQGAKSRTPQDLINFKAAVLANDPFSAANKIDASGREFRRGETVHLVIVGTPLDPSVYTYPMTKAAPGQKPPVILSINYTDTAGLVPLWPIKETPEPEYKIDKIGKTTSATLVHKKAPITFEQELLIPADATPGPKVLKFSIKGQVCDKTSCIPMDYPLETTINVSDAPAVALNADMQQRLKEKPPALKEVPLPAGVDIGEPAKVQVVPPAVQPTPPAPRQVNTGLLSALAASMAAAIAMLFTPCVFPMIPITVSFFLKQSEKKNHNALLTAGVYSLTIIVVLALAVLILGQLIVTLANNPWLNLGLGAMLVFFALSLFGMYEIELPSGLARFTSAHEGQGGYAGAFFMALTFTITSFTCTGPFLGPLLVGAKVFELNTFELALSALVYSATFAAPFFVLALFPRLLKSLPKSGAWLNSVKVVMGFLELAAALKFLGNTDISWNPGNPMLFNYETVLCGWIALSLLCGLYLIGLYRLPHDTPVDHVGVPRMLLASIFFGLGLYMLPALWRETPQGVIGRGVVAFLPLDTKPRKATGGGDSQAHLDWHKDYEKAWEQAVREDKLIFIDFTGVNCTNCRANENDVFPLADVNKELKKYVRVQLYNDSVPDPNLSAADATKAAERNSLWQKNTFGDITTPLYAIIKPNKKQAVVDDKLSGTILGTFSGFIPTNEVPSFLAFVRGPVTDPTAQAANRPTHPEWHKDYEKAWEQAVREHKLLFIDFTGVLCVNCRANENDIFPLADVDKELKKYVRVQLYNDSVPDPALSAAAAKRAAERNSLWQQKTFGDIATPYYAILKPDKAQSIVDDKLNGTILGTFKGFIATDKIPNFLAFVKGPVEGKVAQAGR